MRGVELPFYVSLAATPMPEGTSVNPIHEPLSAVASFLESVGQPVLASWAERGPTTSCHHPVCCQARTHLSLHLESVFLQVARDVSAGQTSEGIRVTHTSTSSDLTHVLKYFLGSWFSQIVSLEMGDRAVKPESCTKSDPTRASSPHSISLWAYSGILPNLHRYAISITEALPQT